MGKVQTPIRDSFKKKVEKHLKKHNVKDADTSFVDHKHQNESIQEMKETQLKKKIAHFRAEKKKLGIKEGKDWHSPPARITNNHTDPKMIKQIAKNLAKDPAKWKEISSGKKVKEEGFLPRLNAFHKSNEKGFDHSSQEHGYGGKSGTGVTVTHDGDRATQKAADHIRRGALSMKKSNRDKFKNHMTHVDTTQHADGTTTDTYKDKAGVHYDAHHDPETNTMHVSRTKSRIKEAEDYKNWRKEKFDDKETTRKVVEDSAAPTNAMGASDSQGTGPIEIFDPKLGMKKKKEKLFKVWKRMGWMPDDK